MPNRPVRASYRVEYPIQERPELILDEVVLAVHDLSESGLRFAMRIDFEVAAGDRLEGEIRFRERRRIAVRGSVVWIGRGLAALAFDDPLAFETIVAEQEYLTGR